MNRLKISDQAFVRELNTSVVMDHIRLYAPLSRAELATRTGLNRSTISIIINELIERGFVQETTRQDPTIGRPGLLLQFNPEGGFAVGVEMGVDFISVVLTNFVAEILWRKTEEVAPQSSHITVMERAEELINEAMQVGAAHNLRALGIGVGVPGLVDSRQGKLVYAPNLNWVDLPIRLIWMSRFNLPVFVENEANCAALGEHFYGVAHDVNNFIYLKTGVGLGAGILVDGQLFKGSHGFGGEVGHTSLYGDGDLCGCGRRGCWETYVRPAAILQQARRRLQAGEAPQLLDELGGDVQGLTLDRLVQAAQQADPMAQAVFAEVAAHMGVGIANLANTFNPELIVLGGALTDCSPELISDIRKSLQETVLQPLRESIRVEASAQGMDAPVLGAVALVLDNILREPLYSIER